MTRPRLSVLLPIYNEERELAACLREVLESPTPFEIIAVDDCSTDATPQILNAQSDPRLRIVRHSENRGKGGAIQTALKYAAGDVVIIQDADTEYSPRDYDALLEAYTAYRPASESKRHVVYGVRDLSTQPLVGYLGNVFLTAMTNLLYGTQLRDMETCYKVVPTELMRELGLQSRGFEVEPEITAKLARRRVNFVQVPVSYRPRTDKKLHRLKDGWKSLKALWHYRNAC
jgi:glycosyltransferase involved in cell wall biosynthesis